MTQEGLIDVVVRFHDATRISELSRAVFSLVSQTYRPIRIILATQRFSEAQIAATKAALAPLLEGEAGVELTIANWANPDPVDARSVLLNLGVEAARGRYLAYLDYDDALYPDAFELMTGRLKATGAAIAFASVRIMLLDVYEDFFHAVGKKVPPWSGRNLMDLFRNNFCPIHSYVIDRQQVAPELLLFSASLLMEEDYDVLLRICSRYLSDFALIGTEIGEYYYKTDGSNTVPTHGVLSAQSVQRYKGVRVTIEHRKRITLVSEAVQRSLRIPIANGPITVRDVIDRYA